MISNIDLCLDVNINIYTKFAYFIQLFGKVIQTFKKHSYFDHTKETDIISMLL